MKFLPPGLMPKASERALITIPRMVAVLVPDPVDEKAFRSQLRRCSQQLAEIGWPLIDQREVENLEGYRRWISDSGPTADGAVAFAGELRALTNDICAGARTPLAGVLATGTYLKGDSLSIDRGSPLQVSQRLLRSLADVIQAESSEVIAIADDPAVEAGSAFCKLVSSGAFDTLERVTSVWKQRGDHDWALRTERLVAFACFDDARVIARPPEPGVRGLLACLAKVDPALRSVIDTAKPGKIKRRLEHRSAAILSVFNEYSTGRERNAARLFVYKQFGTFERLPLPDWND